MPVKKGGRRGGIVKSKGKEKPQEKQAVDKEKRAEPQEITGVAVAKKQATNLQSAQKTLQQAENKPEQPDTTAQDLLATTKKRQKLADELQMVEKQIFDLETRYLENSHPLGSAIKGYQGLLAQNPGNTRRTIVRQEDRLFSNSSLSGVPH